jgi:hypothetical protein
MADQGRGFFEGQRDGSVFRVHLCRQFRFLDFGKHDPGPLGEAEFL